MTSPDEPLVNSQESAVTDVPASLLGELSEILQKDVKQPSKTSDTMSEAIAETSVAPSAGVVLETESSVIMIDDSLHDTVLVAESAEQDRILIIDRDEPDSSFEERKKGRERRELLKKHRWKMILGTGVIIVIIVIILLASPLFRIHDVDVDGRVYTSSDRVEQVIKMMRSQTIFSFDSDKVRQMLRQDPWVDDVRITTHFPRRVVVEISERKPVVWFLGGDNKARIIDSSGFVISVTVGRPTKYLQVTGTGPSLEAGTIADDVYRAAAQLYVALPDEIRPKTKELGVSFSGELSMTLKSGTMVRFGPPTNLQNKLVAVVVLLRRQDPAGLAVIDVSTGEPTVQPR
ncbi:MAG: FtsQ-type POTRA domain-containing protein [Ilumatobacteraceae bacterium]|nr:FtsQ-type POTRA domain-containing protein [Ilumatobacteraceae bacterium]